MLPGSSCCSFFRAVVILAICAARAERRPSRVIALQASVTVIVLPLAWQLTRGLALPGRPGLDDRPGRSGDARRLPHPPPVPRVATTVGASAAHAHRPCLGGPMTAGRRAGPEWSRSGSTIRSPESAGSRGSIGPRPVQRALLALGRRAPAAASGGQPPEVAPLQRSIRLRPGNPGRPLLHRTVPGGARQPHPRQRARGQGRAVHASLRRRSLLRPDPGAGVRVRQRAGVCVSALWGLSVQDLSAEELDATDPRFPLVACAYAEKPA